MHIKSRFMRSVTKVMKRNPRNTLRLVLLVLFVAALNLTNFTLDRVNNIGADSSDKQILSVVGAVVFGFGTLLVALAVSQKLKVKSRIALGFIFFLTIAAMQELTVGWICTESVGNQSAPLKSYYCRSGPVLFSVVYSEVLEVLLSSRYRGLELMLLAYFSFRREYLAANLQRDLVEGTLNLVFMVVTRGLYSYRGNFTDACFGSCKCCSKKKVRESGAMKAANDVANAMNISAAASKLFHKHTKSLALVQNPSMMIGQSAGAAEEKDSTFESNNDYEDSVEEAKDNESVTLSELAKNMDLGFDYDYCMVFAKSLSEFYEADG